MVVFDFLLQRQKERERHLFANKQANRNTIVHQSCKLYNNNEIMAYILDVTKITFNLGKIGKSKEEKINTHTPV